MLNRAIFKDACFNCYYWTRWSHTNYQIAYVYKTAHCQSPNVIDHLALATSGTFVCADYRREGQMRLAWFNDYKSWPKERQDSWGKSGGYLSLFTNAYRKQIATIEWFYDHICYAYFVCENEPNILLRLGGFRTVADAKAAIYACIVGLREPHPDSIYQVAQSVYKGAEDCEEFEVKFDVFKQAIMIRKRQGASLTDWEVYRGRDTL
jgi:hypothetical protein